MPGAACRVAMSARCVGVMKGDFTMEWIESQPGNGAGRTSIWERRALMSGILFAAVAVISKVFLMLFVFPESASPGDPPAERAEFFFEHGSRMLFSTYLLMLQVPFLIAFLMGVFVILRRAEGGSGILSLTALGSGLVMTAMLYVGWMIAGTMTTFIADEGGSAETISALDGLAPMSLALSAFPRALLMGAISAVLLERKLAPRWIGITGVVLAAIHLAGTVTLVIGDLFPVLAIGSLLFTVWVFALAVSLLRRTEPATQATPQAVPA
jgi:hypothetical protein